MGEKEKGLTQDATNEGGRGFCSPSYFCHHDSLFSEGPDLQNRSERDKKKKTED